MTLKMTKERYLRLRSMVRSHPVFSPGSYAREIYKKERKKIKSSSRDQVDEPVMRGRESEDTAAGTWPLTMGEGMKE